MNNLSMNNFSHEQSPHVVLSKGFSPIIQHHTVPLVEENMSNLTSASGDQAGSVSSNQQSFVSPNSHPNPNPTPNPNPAKKKRNLPGNPDPEAEVIALSPHTLMATNRFVCEICNKGFQRDQNLQLHRRGHNLPWKLKQRSSKDALRKKVYICPETSCVHHDPARALGDLTGIKKHFSRKHGEKKWKCEKCSKKYAVQSDWKAHSKICGTREYRCDCGTLFSRRDSFITHRAFCDALAEESARAISTATPLTLPHNPHATQSALFHHQTLEPSPLNPTSLQVQMQAHSHLQHNSNVPSWLNYHMDHLPSAQTIYMQENNIQSPSPVGIPTGTSISSHMSATALLQKAAQMGAALSKPTYQGHMASLSTSTTSSSTNVAGLGLSSNQTLIRDAMLRNHLSSHYESGLEDGGHGGGNGSDGMTRDFLGLRAFSHRDFLDHMAGLAPCMASSSYDLNQQNKKPWLG
ncbi:protein indeterminate-domain 12-like [Carex rostrata]